MYGLSPISLSVFVNWQIRRDKTSHRLFLHEELYQVLGHMSTICFFFKSIFIFFLLSMLYLHHYDIYMYKSLRIRQSCCSFIFCHYQIFIDYLRMQQFLGIGITVLKIFMQHSPNTNDSFYLFILQYNSFLQINAI